MNRPDASTEKEFNNAGIFFLEVKSIADDFFEGSYIGVDVEIAVINGAAVTVIPDFSMSIVNRRGVALYMSDWKMIEREDQRLLTFRASQRVPEDMAPYDARVRDHAQTFMDMCFYAGNEAIPEDFTVDTITRLKPGAICTDLGWHLPSRFVDALIDALGKLNDCVLGGNMSEAILYGIVSKP